MFGTPLVDSLIAALLPDVDAEAVVDVRTTPGSRRLRDVGSSPPDGGLSSEAVWWRCHRRITVDYAVLHLARDGRLTEQRPTAGTRLLDDGLLVHDAARAAPPYGDNSDQQHQLDQQTEATMNRALWPVATAELG
ncbi:hypothetical protein [Microbispora sp. H10836]|uniref:hypothetical protein n=1 Tax=Microbispora sp. H10836 TaxID=2729106 RepID=UPI001B8B772C|nr:hypothetical protein [Microbispora sp. H10836]